MAIVHLVRHGSHAEVGKVLSGRSGIRLDALGRKQGQRLGRCYESQVVDAVYASPRPRAMQTAAFIAEACGRPVQVGDALDEIDFGAWTGRRFTELDGDPLWVHWNEARNEAQPPEGETMAAAAKRAVGCIADIASRVAGLAVVVSHCDIIRGVIAHYLGLAHDRLLAFDVDTASVSRLSVGSWGGRVLSVNECWI
jgi:broad specificity phosphatase PhoE